jgi:hypothetical protein
MARDRPKRWLRSAVGPQIPRGQRGHGSKHLPENEAKDALVYGLLDGMVDD